MPRDRDLQTFTNRSAAGQLLAAQLRGRVGTGAVVLGLTRGGVPVAVEVARSLAVPLDLIVVARLGIPWRPEVAMGALGEGEARVIDDRIVESATVSPHDVDAVERHERVRLGERVARLRGVRSPRMLGGRTAVIVDDGAATGNSARVACQVARSRGARRIIVAVPVASAASMRRLAGVADDVVALQVPLDFVGVGQAYLDFGPIDDDDVVALIAADEIDGPDGDPKSLRRPAFPVEIEELVVPVGTASLAGRLAMPRGARDLVIVAHDSSRERCSARSRYLSQLLTEAGLATLLVDLLTRDEEMHGNRYLAIPLLADRLRAVTATVGAGFDRISYLGDGVAAAIALEAAALDPGIHAVACLGGRPDLVARIGAVRAPTLLVVGQEDSAVRRLNDQAVEKLTCPYRLVTIPGCGHRFREPGALRHAAADLRAWFLAPGDQESHPLTPTRPELPVPS